MEAHAFDLRAEVGRELTAHVVRDWRGAPLDSPTLAVLAYAEKLTRSPGEMRAEDVDMLREEGWDDRSIHDAAQVVAYFNYINRIADGLGVDPEDWMAQKRGGERKPS